MSDSNLVHDGVNGIVDQMQSIQLLMSKAMVDNTHYGVIPGCGDKPALLKPGAEKICLLFRIAPSYQIERLDLPGEHREYITTCKLIHIPTGDVLGEGVGSCSTMEKKWRYSWENTKVPVPSEYWDTKDVSILGGSRFSPRKTWIDKKQVWVIFEKIDRGDPADSYNTCLKMSKKRALVDGTLTVTAASDIFIQDLDDEIDNAPSSQRTEQKPEPKKEAPKSNGTKDGISEKYQIELDNLLMEKFEHADIAEEWLSGKTEGRVKSPKDVVSMKQLGWIKGQLKDA